MQVWYQLTRKNFLRFIRKQAVLFIGISLALMAASWDLQVTINRLEGEHVSQKVRADGLVLKLEVLAAEKREAEDQLAANYEENLMNPGNR